MFLVAGVLVLGVLFWRLGPGDVLRLVAGIGWNGLPLVALFAAHIALRALALQACVLRPGLLRYRDALAIRCSGEAVQALTFTGPALAEPTKAWLLERRGLSRQEGYAATLAEYLINTFIVSAMAVPALLYLAGRPEASTLVSRVAVGVAAGMVVFLLVSAVAIARRYYLIGTVIAGLGRIGVLRGRLRPPGTGVQGMEDLLLVVLREEPRRFLRVAGILAVGQVCLVLEVLWAVYALGLQAPALHGFIIEASVKFVSIAFAFVPMQVGAAEGVYSVVFDVLALPASAGFALAFVRRLRTLLVAGVGLATLARGSRRRVEA